MNAPVNNVVTTTPTVESSRPGTMTGRISENLVSMPPVKRMMLNAIVPMNCASWALLNCSPRPSLPNSIPTMRNINNVGMPNP